MNPISIPAAIQRYINGSISRDQMVVLARQGYQRLSHGYPEVSVVMPAYNEEDNIVPTLLSLCENQTHRSVEIIVVNNNSKDRTGELATACGVTCVFQPVQGITPSRNMGLETARGKYILNADADSIYPKDWIEQMVKPMDNDSIALTYGNFATIPTASTGRTFYFFYEYVSSISRWINARIKDEAVNVYGFNSGFRREQGLAVDKFNHPPCTNEDGYLAVKLRDHGKFGKLFNVTAPSALVWTTDRRLQIDGGPVKGIMKRVKRTILRR